MAALYLAVDAGGTRTTYVLADQHGILARAQAGSIKRLRVPAQIADQNLDDALLQLGRASGRRVAEVTRTCVGIAGESIPQVREWVERAFAERVGGRLLIGGDVDIALDAAFQGGRGVLVLAGTGSNVLARAADGEIFNVGGWGPILGDQGSGYWIGRESLQAAFRAVNEGRPSRFLQELMRVWRANTLSDVVERAHSQPAPDFASLSPIVEELASAGDHDSQEVLLRAGDELAAQVRAVILRMREHEQRITPSDPWQMPAVACAGSVLQHIAALRAAMISNLTDTFGRVDILAGVVDPVMGALWRARA